MGSEYKIWKGSFTSGQHGDHVKGKIDIEMPDPLVLDEPSTLRAAISYTGMYRNGTRVLLVLRNDGNKVTSKQQNPTFVGLVGTQGISFKCDSVTEFQMTGTYETHNPDDSGNFSIQITSDILFDETERKGMMDVCIIS